jgi:lysophospholipase L1-like esterase
LDITADYIGWLSAMRKACPSARFFCIVPPLGLHRAEVEAAVSPRNKAGDQKVYLIDTASLQDAFRAGQGATQLAYDGVHPSQYGQARLGGLIAVEVQKILSREAQFSPTP